RVGKKWRSHTYTHHLPPSVTGPKPLSGTSGPGPVMHTIEFCFDYISPYAYLGWQRARRWSSHREDITLKPRPILFAALLNHWGQLGPAEIAPKRAFVLRDVVRNAVMD